MTEATLVDAQFGVARVIKPFPGFESVYQGQPVSTPIAFPGTLDDDAGKPGFDPNLLKGIPVPLGSKILLWIPTAFNQTPAGDFQNVVDYKYKFLFRLRNLRDFRESRKAYHFPKNSPGENDGASKSRAHWLRSHPSFFSTNPSLASTPSPCRMCRASCAA